jgi:hypothetical protein
MTHLKTAGLMLKMRHGDGGVEKIEAGLGFPMFSCGGLKNRRGGNTKISNLPRLLKRVGPTRPLLSIQFNVINFYRNKDNS